LDQNRISKTEFRREQVTVTATDRIALRGLFQSAGVLCKSQEEVAKAQEFVETVTQLMLAAGGPEPLPPSPTLPGWDSARQTNGNAQLAAILAVKETLETAIPEWRDRAELRHVREAQWKQATQLAHHARHLADATELLRELDHIRSERLLLVSSNPLDMVRSGLTDLLRAALNELHANHSAAYQSTRQQLEATGVWQHLDEADGNRIMSEVALAPPSTPDVSNTATILTALDTRDLDARRAEIDAVPGRAARALEQAARHLEPKVQAVAIERATLRSETEVRSWAERQQQRLLDALKKGPVLVS
jgi:hypothetical protein